MSEAPLYARRASAAITAPLSTCVPGGNHLIYIYGYYIYIYIYGYYIYIYIPLSTCVPHASTFSGSYLPPPWRRRYTSKLPTSQERTYTRPSASSRRKPPFNHRMARPRNGGTPSAHRERIGFAAHMLHRWGQARPPLASEEGTT